MARFDPAGFAGRVARSAQAAAATLRAEYEAGRAGDDGPTAKLWGSPREQLHAIMRHLRAARPVPPEPSPDATGDAPEPGPDAASADAPGTGPVEPDPADAAEVAQTLLGVDWAAVRAATGERTSEAARAMRTMAEQVDWGKVQPVAAQVSSALIAAVASGRIGVGGPVGSVVARAIIDQGGLSQRVADQLHDRGAALPPDFRGAIEATLHDE